MSTAPSAAPAPRTPSGEWVATWLAGGVRSSGDQGPGGDQSSTARQSAVVAVWTLVSRVTGLLRVLVVGALMGPTYLSNVFQAGYVLPGNVFTILAGPVLAMVVVPVLVRALTAGGLDRANQLFSRIAGRLLAVAGLGGLALAVAAPALAWTLSATVPEPDRARAWLWTTVLILFVAPQVVLYGIATLGVAAQQARGRFALAAAAPAAESVGVIATVGLACWIYGTGLEVGDAPLSMMIVLGAGSTLAVVLQAGLQAYGAARVGMFALPTRGWREDLQARDSIRRIVRSIPVAACPALTNFVLTVVAATVPGGVLVVQLSYQVYYALSYLGARAVSIAALPRLAAAAARHDRAEFGQAWRHGLFYAVLASTPSMCLLAMFAFPTANLLANGELREPTLIAQLAACLTVAAFAQLIGGIHDLGKQALFARLDDNGPRLASILALSVTVGIAASTLLLDAQDARLPALIIAILAGETVGAVTVLSRLRRAMQPEPLVDRHSALVASTATAAMLPPITAGAWLLSNIAVERYVVLGILLVCGALTVAAFAAVIKLLNRPDSSAALSTSPSFTEGEPIVTVSSRPDDRELKEWDRIVAEVPGSDVSQLSGWAAVRRTAGYTALYVFAWQRGRLVGGVQVLLRRVPLLGQVGYVSYAPLIAPHAPRDEVLTAMADALETLARRRVRALFVQPLDSDDVSTALLARGFRASTAGVAPSSTVRIDLTADEDQLRAGLSKRIRRWTGKWEKSGVRVRRASADDLGLLTDLIGRSALHQGFAELSPDYVRNLYQQLSASGNAEIFVGEVDGEPVAAELLTACGGVLRSRLTGLDRTSPATRLSVTSALDWEAMLWARRNGFREFDLGGLSASAAAAIRAAGFSSPELDGPDRFKAGFGGRLHTYPPAVELISSRLLRVAYDMLDSASFGRSVLNQVRYWMRQSGRRRGQ
ncbi:MAG TPA: GNAT family N-acetyltransferase [Pseudonocardia sp.]|uniref:GNAT family N-acetyltransferase n=1 Tax=Pseudonocardia sp. TaxID=60912 RepID=UPI002BF442D6|nr:GNAT family N-acetyltransferase [Pseudonocardia sp.]HTF51506.1 GNAT family N-acetyltransferase [Pseudonocardia sp.]